MKIRKYLSNSSNDSLNIVYLQFLLFLMNDAVKAGGMRIVQHKTGTKMEPGKSEPVEVIGYSQNNPIDTNVQLSTSPTQRVIVVESSQTSHAYKPAVIVPHKTVNHIQQPRKQ